MAVEPAGRVHSPVRTINTVLVRREFYARTKEYTIVEQAIEQN